MAMGAGGSGAIGKAALVALPLALAVGNPAAGQEIVVVPGARALQQLGGQNKAMKDMARSIDAVCPTLVANTPLLNPAQTDLRNVCQRMVQTARAITDPNAPTPVSYGLDQGETNNALQSIAGEELQSPQVQSSRMQDTQMSNVRMRMEAMRMGVMGPMLSIAGMTPSDGTILIGGDADDRLMEGGGLLGDRLGVFLIGGLGLGDRDSTDELDSFDFTTYGLTLGADYRVTERLLLGVGLGLSRFDADFDTTQRSPSGQKLDSDAYTLSLYGTWYPTDQLFFDAVLSVGYSDYDSKRRVVIDSETDQPSENRTARADFDGWLYGASVSGGYDIPVARGLTITPTAGLDYSHADIDGFEENGAGGLNLAFGDQEADSFTANIGLQASYAWSTEFGVVTPTLRGMWVFELLDDDDGARVQYANDPTGLSAFRLSTVAKDSSYGVVGGGVAATLPHNLSLFAEYDTVVGLDDFTIHRFALGLRMSF
jgi:outer membrane lipase/esterase